MSYIQDWKKECLKTKAQLIKTLDEAYPDIGIGKSWSLCVNQAAQQLHITNQIIIKEVILCQ